MFKSSKDENPESKNVKVVALQARWQRIHVFLFSLIMTVSFFDLEDEDDMTVMKLLGVYWV
jgi:hypothetical protein